MCTPQPRRRLSGRRARAGIGLAVALALLGGCESGPVLPDLEVSQSAYLLDHGDRAEITVFGQPELSGERVIDGEGNIAMPLIGTVPAGGGTAAELENRIADALTPQFLHDPKVSVQVIAYRPFYIVGEVKSPGAYPYVEGMVVMHAVALAEGFTYRARQDGFYIIRSVDPERHRRYAGRDTPVLAGDLIVVRERYF